MPSNSLPVLLIPQSGMSLLFHLHSIAKTCTQDLGRGEQTEAKDCHCCQIQGTWSANKDQLLCLLSRCKNHRRWYVHLILPLKLSSDSGIACLDGALHMWQTNTNFVRPNLSIEGAHTKGFETGSLVFSVDGRTVLTRAADNTVKCKPLAPPSWLSANERMGSVGYAFVQEAFGSTIWHRDAVPSDKRHV